MDLGAYDFDLPDDRIARYPAEPADASRLMSITAKGDISHHIFRDLPGLLREGDLLVFNRTRVSHRRVRLQRSTGAEFEALFLETAGTTSRWKCMIRRSARLRTGEVLTRGSGKFRVIGRDGPLCVLEAADSEGEIWKAAQDAEQFFEKEGEPPIPPYLGRRAEETDRRRYQTVFATTPGSVAAPTAGLHFTSGLLAAVAELHPIAFVELTIGYGTFAPLTPENFEKGCLHQESFWIPDETALLLNRSRAEGKRIVAVGTTTLRALETVRRRHGQFRAGRFETDIFIFPPDRPTACDVLITNFHLPASSLFLLVCAFAGTRRMLDAYARAIAQGYRFYSYGDAMLVERPAD